MNEEASSDFPLITDTRPLIGANVVLQIIVGVFFYVLLPWSMLICAKKKKELPVTKSMMTTTVPPASVPPAPFNSKPFAAAPSDSTLLGASGASNTGGESNAALQKKEDKSEEKKDDGEKKDDPKKEDKPKDDELKSKSDKDKKAEDDKKKSEKEQKSKKAASVAGKPEEDDGYEACPDMTPEQLAKFCKESSQK